MKDVVVECIPLPADGEIPFEFVLTPNPELAAQARADGAPYAEYLTEEGSGAVTFPSVRGAYLLLVIPQDAAGNPRRTPLTYLSLAQFVRTGPPGQIDTVWQATARAIHAQRARWPGHVLWLSTHGLGVHWLHLRVSIKPNYYHFSPYRSVVAAEIYARKRENVCGGAPATLKYAEISGDVSHHDRNAIQKTFNSPKNAKGDLIRVLLVSKTGAEGPT